MRAGLVAEGHLLFPKSLDILVDVALKLSLDLVPLDHLHHLLLLLIQRTVCRSDFLQPKTDIVCKGLSHSSIN